MSLRKKFCQICKKIALQLAVHCYEILIISLWAICIKLKITIVFCKHKLVKF